MAIQKVGVELSRTREFDNVISHAIPGGDFGLNQIPVDGLYPNTVYYVRAFFDQNGVRTMSSNIGKFITLGDMFSIVNTYAGPNDMAVIVDGTPDSTDLEYSSDGQVWKPFDLTQPDTTITIPEDGAIYLRSSTGFSGMNGHIKIKCAEEFIASGDTRQLLNYLDVASAELTGYDFYCMFFGASTLTSASRIKLPYKEMARSSYESMFEGCTSLEDTPVIDAVSMATDCFQGMFQGCTRVNDVTVYIEAWDTWNSYNWLSDCAQIGTVHNLGGATIPTGTTAGIPYGWTVTN